MPRHLSHTSRRQHTDLTSLVKFPHGLCVVDLFDPLHLVHVELAKTDQPPQVYRELEESMIATGQPTLPAEWVRLAVTTGIDRWLELPPDDMPFFHDGILQADLAYAHHQVGNTAESNYYYTAAKPALRQLFSRLPRANGAVFEEFARIYAAAPYGIPAGKLRQLISPAGTTIYNDTGEHDHDTPNRATRTRSADAGRRVRVVTDPRLVPARMIVPETAEVIVNQDAMRVSVGAFPDVTADTPGSQRLFARLLADKRTIALGNLTLNNHRLSTTLPANNDPGVLIVEIYDTAISGGPYVDEQNRVVARRITATREAYTWQRLAQAAEKIGDNVASESAHQLALNRAAGFPTIELENRILARKLSAPEGPLRPLLAELVSQQPIAIHT